MIFKSSGSIITGECLGHRNNDGWESWVESVFDRFGRGVVDVLQRYASLRRKLFTRLEFRGCLQGLSIQFADFDRDLTEFCFDRHELALQLAALGGGTPEAKRAGLAQDQL